MGVTSTRYNIKHDNFSCCIYVGRIRYHTMGIQSTVVVADVVLKGMVAYSTSFFRLSCNAKNCRRIIRCVLAVEPSGATDYSALEAETTSLSSWKLGSVGMRINTN